MAFQKINFLFNCRKRIKNSSSWGGVLHFHEELEIIAVIDGYINMFVNNKEYRINRGEFIIINPFAPHKTINYSESSNDILIHISKDFLGNSTNCINDYFSGKITLEHLISNEEFFDIIISINNIFEKNENFWELDIKGLIFRLLSALFKNHKINTKNVFKDSKKFNCVTSAIKFINSNFCRNITLKDVADEIKYSSSHLCRVFPIHTGYTVNEYINTLRLEKARQLIKEQNLSLKQVAYESGFSDYNYFSRMFKKHFDMSPSKLKEQK